MRITHKVLEKNGRSLYLYYPAGEPRVPYRRSSLMVLLDEVDGASVRHLLDGGGLAALADREGILLAFPIPAESGWNHALAPEGPDDLSVLVEMLSCLDVDRPVEPAVKPGGIPTLDAMLHSWHPMHDVRYVAGEGCGAAMALTLAACRPECFAAMAAFGGSLSLEALTEAVRAPMPAWLAGVDEPTVRWLREMNEALEPASDSSLAEGTRWQCVRNPLQQVFVEKDAAPLCRATLERVWSNLFARVRRPNSGSRGDIEPRVDLRAAGIECHVDECLPGLDGNAHTWFVHVPARLRVSPAIRAPLLVFFHGGSDNPAEAADMSRFHEVGEREGFITAYPWGTNRASWNMEMDPDGCDDVAFTLSLIDHMIARYPVDERRIYLSGFSNGAGMAQTVAMTHPERIAAICPIDSNWPGDRLGPADVDYAQVRPFALAMRRKETRDFRMPIWYTYGTREPSYPVYRRCTQQHQYDFWKWFNRIPIRRTPDREAPHPCGCGVLGDMSERLHPSTRHPDHAYDVQRFLSDDPEPLNLYNYVLMRDKGHDIAEMDAALGWAYVSRWGRQRDGSLIRW